MSGATDCYQRLEAWYRLTPQCLEVCAEYRNPVPIVTEGALIERDLDVLERLASLFDWYAARPSTVWRSRARSAARFAWLASAGWQGDRKSLRHRRLGCGN